MRPPRLHSPLLALALVPAALAACSSRGDDAPGNLQFGTGHTVARVFDTGAHAARLTRVGGTLHAVWSAPAGTHMRALKDDGRPAGPSHRLFPPCPRGLDVASSEGTLRVACLRRAHPSMDKPAAVWLLHVEPGGHILARTRLATPGPDSEGVALALHKGAAVLLWHAATPTRSRIRLAKVRDGKPSAQPRTVSTLGAHAQDPDILAVGDHLLGSWVERWIESGRGRAHVVVRHGSQAPRKVETVHGRGATPQLVRWNERVVLAFRDLRGSRDRAGLYLRPLDEQGKPTGSARRIGRANGPTRAVAVACEPGLFTVAPRSWGSDLILGINWVGEHLQLRSAEHQYYEYDVSFSQGDAACSDRGIVVLAAEQTSSIQHSGKLHTTTLRTGPD